MAAAEGEAARALNQANNSIFSTDSVGLQINYGFAGDIGVSPSMDHRIDETGVSVPSCYTESRDNVACK